ncbi:hypothetical protein B7486_75320, partial [cyanobacterium TDX16]
MSEQRSVVEQAADVVFYAPVGFALEVRRLVPELAERGRRQVTFNWMVGRYAVRRARARADEVVDLVSETAGGLLDLAGIDLGSTTTAEDDAAGATVAPDADDAPQDAGPSEQPAVRLVPDPEPDATPSEPAPDPDDLAIPGYDTLSAFQVVPRLEGLGG